MTRQVGPPIHSTGDLQVANCNRSQVEMHGDPVREISSFQAIQGTRTPEYGTLTTVDGKTVGVSTGLVGLKKRGTPREAQGQSSLMGPCPCPCIFLLLSFVKENLFRL
jgi:hypothetical protein